MGIVNDIAEIIVHVVRSNGWLGQGVQVILYIVYYHDYRPITIVTHLPRRGTCLALRLQTGSWMLFIDSRNWNKMAAFYTVHTSSIRIFNCLYSPNLTLKTY